MTDLHYAVGDLLFTEGSASTYVLRVADGEAEVFKTVDGQEITLGRVKPGDFVGEMGVIQNRPRGASVRAVKPMTVERFGRDDFLERISRDSAMALRLLVRLSERLNLLDQAFAEATLEAATAPKTESAPPAAGASVTLRAGDPLLAAALPAERLRLKRLPFTVGRMPAPGEAAAPMTIDLLLDDSPPYRLSRAHFRVTEGGEGTGGLQVQDLGSVLGTIVNGTPIGMHFGSDSAGLAVGETEVVAGGAESHFRFLITVEAA